MNAVSVRVPASSANLGPGFDVLGCALGLHVELEVRETGDFAVQTELPIARDRRNLIVRAFARLLAPDNYEFRIGSAIPLSGGLGSSASAIIAGLVAADALGVGSADLLALATGLEGHPDNVAAALHGGFVLCADANVTRLAVPDWLGAVLVVPADPVRTIAARAALPSAVPIGDAVFTASRTAMLVLGLERGDRDLVAAGVADRLHQPRRAHLYPRSYELLGRATDLGALGATISGAGPTVLIWCEREKAASVAERLTRECAGWAEVLAVPFDGAGATVLIDG